jgi:hypothetical protein
MSVESEFIRRYFTLPCRFAVDAGRDAPGETTALSMPVFTKHEGMGYPSGKKGTANK